MKKVNKAGGKTTKGQLAPLRIRQDAAGIDIGATELFALYLRIRR